MSLKEKVSITFMLNQSKSWKDNHKVTVESKDKTPTITLASLYKIVVEGFDQINSRIDSIDNRLTKVEDVLKRNNLK